MRRACSSAVRACQVHDSVVSCVLQGDHAKRPTPKRSAADVAGRRISAAADTAYEKDESDADNEDDEVVHVVSAGLLLSICGVHDCRHCFSTCPMCRRTL